MLGDMIESLSASSVMQAGWLALAGVLVTRVLLRRHSTVKLIAQLAFFGAMTALLLAKGFAPYELDPDRVASTRTMILGAVKIIWWMSLAWALIAFVRLYLVLERTPREARLLQEIVVGLIYLGALLSIVAFVFGVPVGTLLATSGIFAVILGLALQNTLSDVFSGIALNLGRPFVLGNWIVLSDGIEGRVVESNWRSTHLLTASHNLVVLPNSVLAKLSLTNISSPDESSGMSFSIRLAPTKMPSIIVDAMENVLLSCNAILKNPGPAVALKSLDAAALEIELQFRVPNIAHGMIAKNEVIDLVYRHIKSAGLLLANPASSVLAMSELPTEENARPPQVSPLELFDAIPLFAALTDDERRFLAANVSTRTYRKDEVVVREGETLSTLMIVRSGVLAVRRNGAQGDEEDRRLAPGDIFGETGLFTGTGETATLTAITHVVVYEIDQVSFAALLKDRPCMAEELATILARRAATISARYSLSHEPAHGHSVAEILQSIRTMFRSLKPSK
jgi:small-conductance mechanosensitive channel/CRP-like cAMP-binding protein